MLHTLDLFYPFHRYKHSKHPQEQEEAIEDDSRYSSFLGVPEEMQQVNCDVTSGRYQRRWKW